MWLFLMKSQAGYFQIFNYFLPKFALNSILLSASCTMIMHWNTSHDILHQSSSAYPPQENEVTEWKNRHLVEITHTLLHHIVPQRFARDVILTACYLINHIVGRYFIFTDVTFFEESSLFSSVELPQVPNVLSLTLVLPSLDSLPSNVQPWSS